MRESAARSSSVSRGPVAGALQPARTTPTNERVASLMTGSSQQGSGQPRKSDRKARAVTLSPDLQTIGCVAIGYVPHRRHFALPTSQHNVTDGNSGESAGNRGYFAVSQIASAVEKPLRRAHRAGCTRSFAHRVRAPRNAFSARLGRVATIPPGEDFAPSENCVTDDACSHSVERTA